MQKDKLQNKFMGGKDRKRLNQYQLSLINPSIKNSVRIPGTWGRSSVAMHRFYSQTITTNANGHFSYMSCPNEVLASNATQSTTQYTVDALYNPANALFTGGGVIVDTRPWYNLTNGTARSVRLVSMSISATSLSTSLNRKGTIYGTLINERPFGPTGFGVVASTDFFTIPTIQNAWHKRANVFNGEGVCVNYLPSDDSDMEFLTPNTACQTRHANGDDVYWINIIGQSLEASSSVRIDVNLHYEIIPQPESSLAGIESLAPTNETIPALDIAHIKAYHIDKMIRVVNAYDNATENTLGVKDRPQQSDQRMQGPKIDTKPKNKAFILNKEPKRSGIGKALAVVKDINYYMNKGSDVAKFIKDATASTTNIGKPKTGFLGGFTRRR